MSDFISFSPIFFSTYSWTSSVMCMKLASIVSYDREVHVKLHLKLNKSLTISQKYSNVAYPVHKRGSTFGSNLRVNGSILVVISATPSVENVFPILIAHPIALEVVFCISVNLLNAMESSDFGPTQGSSNGRRRAREQYLMIEFAALNTE